jgi:Uma2 family endonuclease
MVLAHRIREPERFRAERELDWFEGACTLWPRDWTEEEFQILDQSQEPHFLEFADGQIDFLGWPGWDHQAIVADLGSHISRFLTRHRLGEAIWGVCPVRLWPGRWSSPDISWHLNDRLIPHPLRHEYFQGASGVMEVLSHQEDWQEWGSIRKRRDYARAGIGEYWMIDPQKETISVLTLPAEATEYAIHGEFHREQRATSVLLPEFVVDVTACFAAGNPSET